MPPPNEAVLLDKAVLWECVGFDKRGKPKVTDVPVEIDVRWEDGEAKGGGAMIDGVQIDAQVMADRFLPYGSKVWRGELAQVKDATWEEKPEPLMTVVSGKRSFDVKGREEMHGPFGLQRHKDTLPKQV